MPIASLSTPASGVAALRGCMLHPRTNGTVPVESDMHCPLSDYSAKFSYRYAILLMRRGTSTGIVLLKRLSTAAPFFKDDV